MDYGKQLDTPEVGSAGPSHDHMLSVSVSPLNGPIPAPSQEEHHHVVHSHGGHPQHGGHNVDHDKGNKTETVPVSASTVVGQMQPGPNMNTPNNKQAPNGQPFPMPIFNISGNNQVPFLNGLCNPAMFHLFYSQNGSNPMVMTLASSSGATAETNATATSSIPPNWGPQVLTLVPASMSNGQMPSGANGSMPVMTSPMKRLNKNGTPSSNKERIFPCMHPGCNCSFSTRFSLKRHQKKHSGDRPYICNHLASLDGSGKQCGRRFAEMSTLKRHTRTHTGERPYKCDFPGCDKSFADRTNVRRHRQTHEQSKRFACPGDNCNRTFARKGFLSKHLESEHQTMGGSGMANLAAAVSATSGEHDEDDETSDDTDSRVGSPKNGPQQVMQQMAGIQLPIIPSAGPA